MHMFEAYFASTYYFEYVAKNNYKPEDIYTFSAGRIMIQAENDNLLTGLIKYQSFGGKIIKRLGISQDEADLLLMKQTELKNPPVFRTENIPLIKVEDIINLVPQSPGGIIITNPPYGERMKPQSIIELYTSIGNTLKNRFAGFEAWIISSSLDGLKSIGLKPAKKIDLFNGALACSYRCFELFQGTHKQAVIIKKRL